MSISMSAMGGEMTPSSHRLKMPSSFLRTSSIQPAQANELGAVAQERRADVDAVADIRDNHLLRARVCRLAREIDRLAAAGNDHDVPDLPRGHELAGVEAHFSVMQVFAILVIQAAPKAY